MPSANLVQVKIAGLETNNSELSEVNPGSLRDCNNVVLNRESVIEPRRGFKIYGNTMGGSPSTDLAKQLFEYKDRLLRHYSNTLQFDTGSGTFASFSGSYTELVPGIKMKGKEVNGNFYFTTSKGVMKISAKTAADLTTAANYITPAGGVKALNIEATLNPQTGFFEQNSKVAYRVLWGIKDRGGNLLLGYPSQRLVVENPELTLMIKDFNGLLAKLDDEAVAGGADELSDTDYVSSYKINIQSGLTTTVRTNLIALANKLDFDVNLIAAPTYARTSATASVTANVATVVFTTNIPSWVQVGQTYRISGFSDVSLTPLNGDQLITSIAANSISFSLTNPDVVSTADVGATVYQYIFNAITQPVAVENPGTTTMLDSLQDYYDSIIDAIQVLSTAQIANPLNFATNFSTQSATVNLTIAIPDEVTTAHFLQIYRTALAIADGPITIDDVDPGDEMGLVYEANPTAAEITAGTVSVHDVTPESFRGANLYTNPQTGEGILQANEKPPVALDINTFKNHTFYANTQTSQKLQFSLLSVDDLIGGTSKLLVTNGTGVQEYTFTSPVAQVTQIVTVADVAGSLAGTYFLINSALDATEYYVWFKVSGVGADPALSGKTGIQVDIDTADTDLAVATALRIKLNQYSDFIITGGTNQAIVTNVASGITLDAVDSDTGFTITTTTDGDGEDASANKILLSDKPTPSQQVDETARSIERVINKNMVSVVNAYYLSGVNDVPGLLLFESKTLAGLQFYLGSDDAETTGSSFSPALPEVKSITSITATNPAVVTSTAHGLTSGESVVVYSSDSTPELDGTQVVTVIDANTFSVPVNVTTLGTTGKFFYSTVFSDNEVIPNRVYFSKFQQPEAVPIVNYMDVGEKDSQILRIVPLRDSLFVFKDEGIYRISGEGGPQPGFSLALFDSSTSMVASDSAAVLNNQVFMFSDQGIVAVSDTGVNIMSSKIENQLLPLTNLSNFSANTWGISYENDRAYLLSTVTKLNEAISTVIFRYNIFTNSWTKWKISKTCGIIKNAKAYLGVGDTNSIEVERKDFGRTDYADREFIKTLANGSVNDTVISLPSVSNITIGDVIFQEQYLTTYKLNQLLMKLDDDSGVTDTDYFSTLQALPGSNLRDILALLADKLDLDTGVNETDYASSIVAFGTSFANTQSAYNVLVAKLNADIFVQFSNYSPSTDTIKYESIIEAVNTSTSRITVRTPIPLIAGDSIVYNHIPVSITWNVQSFGDSESWKQVSEAKFIFERTNFTGAKIEYSSDINPSFEDTNFTEYGNGTFGNYEFGENPFGGDGDRSPLRTLIPRTKQRCRLLIPKISHSISREKMSLLGYSMLARPYSTKAYR